MAFGKIVEFDPVDGYGFIAPDGGGPSVIFHIDDLGGCRDLYSGTPVKFSSIQGVQGLKAYNVGILAPLSSDRGGFREPADGQIDAAAIDSDGGNLLGAQILSHREYAEEITEILISAIPDVTAMEIAEVLSHFAQRASSRGWLAH